MTTQVSQPAALVCIFTWTGFVCGISFLEAWLKFRAPGVTLPIGLMLFVLRGLYPHQHWNDKLPGAAFRSINIGLLVMVTVSMLPIGIMQAGASIQHGYWYARSAEFM